MSILLIAASPAARSRSATLLDGVAGLLAPASVRVERLALRELPARALLHADYDDAGVQAALGLVAQAQAVVLATPVYKAAYSGMLKVFLDLLPQNGFAGKTVLPLVSGGSPHHMLVIDYALRPVLQALSAQRVLGGVYATDAQLPKGNEGRYAIDAEIAHRLQRAVDELREHADWRMGLEA